LGAKEFHTKSEQPAARFGLGDFGHSCKARTMPGHSHAIQIIILVFQKSLSD